MPELPNFKIRWREERGQYYIFWTEDGKTKRISTGATDKGEARRILAELSHAWLTPPEPDKVTVRQVAEHYMEHKRESYKGDHPRNLEAAQYSLNPITEHLGDMYAETLSRQAIRDYIKKRAPRSTATIRRELQILVAALNYAHKDGWISKVPHVEKPPPPAPRQKWATPEQVRHFLNTIEAPHIKLFAMLALHTLARKSSIVEMKWEQVDLENRLIHYNPEGRTQTAKHRVSVPINKPLYEELERAYDYAVSEWVIEFNGKPVQRIDKGFRKWVNEAGMPWITPHVLRHTGATLMAQNGVSMWEIAGIMGDRLETVERHYAKHHPDYLKSAASALEKLYE